MVGARREHDVQEACGICLSQRVKAWFSQTVLIVSRHDQRLVKKYLFRFGRADSMFFDIFAGIAVIPIEACQAAEIHSCIL